MARQTVRDIEEEKLKEKLRSKRTKRADTRRVNKKGERTLSVREAHERIDVRLGFSSGKFLHTWYYYIANECLGPSSSISSSSEAQSLPLQSEQPPNQKRPRGRPKGSKNKPKYQPPLVSAADTIVSSLRSADVSVSLARGLPSNADSAVQSSGLSFTPTSSIPIIQQRHKTVSFAPLGGQGMNSLNSISPSANFCKEMLSEEEEEEILYSDEEALERQLQGDPHSESFFEDYTRLEEDAGDLTTLLEGLQVVEEATEEDNGNPPSLPMHGASNSVESLALGEGFEAPPAFPSSRPTRARKAPVRFGF